MRNHYTTKEQTELTKSIVILIDTAEKDHKHDHILEAIKKRGRKFKSKSLDFGDYSYMLPKNEELGIVRDIYFDKDIVIERKMSLLELAGNLGGERKRFENELIRKQTCKFYLFVEDGSYEGIRNGSYLKEFERVTHGKSKKKPLGIDSYLGTLGAFEERYDIRLQFDTKKAAGDYILDKMGRHLKEFLKNYY